MEKQFERLVLGDYEILIRTDVGPRIMSFRRGDGPNVFYENPKHVNLGTGGDDYRSYGGHRLLRSPEIDDFTYTPDNDEVEVSIDGSWHCFRSAVDRWQVQKEIRIACQNDAIWIDHRIYNRGDKETDLATWGISVMRPNGSVWVPRRGLDSKFPKLPDQFMALWPYTDLSDPRIFIGERMLRLSHADVPNPTKFGAMIHPGIAFYSHAEFTFIKRFSSGYYRDQPYPDYGCNFEAYTRHDMLEVESLGTFARVPPGGYADHAETWELRDAKSLKSEDEAFEFFQSLNKTKPG